MVRPAFARCLAAASLLTAVTLTTAACGGDGDTEGPGGTPESSESSESSEEPSAGEPAAGGAGVPSTEEPRDEPAEPTGELEELGAAELYPAVTQALREAETFAFAISAGTEGSDVPALDLQGVMRYDDEGIDVQASGSGPGGATLEMVVLDEVLYVSGIGMGRGDETWLKIDMSDPDSLFGMLGRSTDPGLMFKAMEEPQDFELLGTEQIDGVETHHYRVVVDASSYAEAMGLPATMASSLPDDVAGEMWIDADNLPRRFRWDLQVPGTAGTSTTGGTYTDYGTAVSIEAPPASEVAEGVPGM